MDLILWRHAEAQDACDGQGDLERALTTKGERQAERMAQWLTRRLGASTRILVSPAQRCQQTVAALGRAFETVEAIGTDASVAELLEAAGWPDADEPVLVVGHQPTLGLVAARLLADVDQPWSMKKGAVWWLRRRERDGAGAQVVLQAVLGPDCV
jgi:phosphohistidine phosphatase